MRLPTLKTIMAEKKCTIELARTYRALMEADADTEHFRKTGKHLLPVVSASDLERHPELAVQDVIRPKTSERKKDCAQFIEASLEKAVTENDAGILSDALVEIVQGMDRKADNGVVSVLLTVSAGIDMAQALLGKAHLPRRAASRPRTAARRLEPAHA